MVSSWWSNLGRYLAIAYAALAVGIVIGKVMAGRLSEQSFFGPGFSLLVAGYSALHVWVLLFAAVFERIFSVRFRSILYLSLSGIGFLVSIFVLNPLKDGLHVFVIFWGSLVLIALDYFVRANGQTQLR